jgi:hypothetical protein
VKKYSQHRDEWLTVTLDSILLFFASSSIHFLFLAFFLYYLSMVNQTKYAYFLIYYRALNKRTNNPSMISRCSPRPMIGVTQFLYYITNLLSRACRMTYSVTQHRETLLVQRQNNSVKVFSTYMRVDSGRHALFTLPVSCQPFMVSRRSEFLCTRVHIFLFQIFYFSSKKKKILITILFSIIE